MGSNGFGIDCDGHRRRRPDGHLARRHLAPRRLDYSRKWSDPSELLINQGPGGGLRVRERVRSTRKLPFNEGDIDGAAVDFDNDGRIDLVMSARQASTRPATRNPDQKGWFGLIHQRADGTFESVGMTSGINDPADRRDRPR